MSELPFTRLGEEFEIEAVHESTDVTPGPSYVDNDEPNLRIDYVLVYETSQDDESRDEESAAEAERLSLLRTSFEKQLEKQGLVLQHRTSVTQVKTRVYLLNLV